MRDLYCDLLVWLARPGDLSKTCWREAYEIRDHLAAGESDRGIALCKMISVASKTARSRCERLPDGLHNMMVLNSGGVKPEMGSHVEWWSERMRETTARHVRVYVKMLEKLAAQSSRG